MLGDTDGPRACSPWGAIGAYFLIQCFGFVALQGFRMFANIAISGSDELGPLGNVQNMGDQFFLALWGGAWICVFIIVQSVLLHYVWMSLKTDGPLAVITQLRKPTELAKFVVAMALGLEYVRFLLGHYPFPSKPISFWASAAFGILSLAVSALFVAITRSVKRFLPTDAKLRTRPPTPDETVLAVWMCLVGIACGLLFVWFGISVQPKTFYMFGMLGLFVIMLFGSMLLFVPEALRIGIKNIDEDTLATHDKSKASEVDWLENGSWDKFN